MNFGIVEGIEGVRKKTQFRSFDFTNEVSNVVVAFASSVKVINWEKLLTRSRQFQPQPSSNF